MTIIIDKNDRGARASVAQTARYCKKVDQKRPRNAPPKTCLLKVQTEMIFKNHVGNQTVHGFGLWDRRNDKEDCVVKIRGEFSPRFHGKQLCVRFVRRRAKSMHSWVPQHVIECHTKRYFQIPSFGGCIWGLKSLTELSRSPDIREKVDRFRLRDLQRVATWLQIFK